MRNPDEAVAFEIMRKKRLDSEVELAKRQADEAMRHPLASIPIHQKVGTVIPFSKTVDKDPWKDIPLSIPQESPVLIEVWAWTIIAACVGLAYWWVAV